MDETTTGSIQAGRGAHLDRHRTCSCGQELDVCRHAHCPRCGHRLGVRQRVLAA